jgi:hypothetical protein
MTRTPSSPFSKRSRLRRSGGRERCPSSSRHILRLPLAYRHSKRNRQNLTSTRSVHRTEARPTTSRPKRRTAARLIRRSGSASAEETAGRRSEQPEQPEPRQSIILDQMPGQAKPQGTQAGRSELAKVSASKSREVRSTPTAAIG